MKKWQFWTFLVAILSLQSIKKALWLEIEIDVA
jgi:hypothetical protein